MRATVAAIGDGGDRSQPGQHRTERTDRTMGARRARASVRDDPECGRIRRVECLHAQRPPDVVFSDHDQPLWISRDCEDSSTRIVAIARER